MFERYSENARRTIFYARYEASNLGDPEIKAVHLLLGLLREGKALFIRLQIAGEKMEAVREACVKEGSGEPPVPTSVDMRLDSEAESILERAAKEAEVRKDSDIDVQHILLAALFIPSKAQSVLNQQGLTYEQFSNLPPVTKRYEPEGMVKSSSPEAATGGAEGLVEFIWDSLRVGVTDLSTAHLLPRVGEEILISAYGQLRTFKVLDVSYLYEKPPEAAADAPQRLSKVIVRVESQTSPGEAKFRDYT